MKQKLFAMCAVAVLLLGMSACSKEDTPAPNNVNVQEQDLVGLWWDEFEYADVTEDNVPFSRVLLAVQANADHTGCIYLGVFNNTSDEPLAVYGGPEDAGFTWRLLANGNIVLGDPVTGEEYALTRSYGNGATDVPNTSLTYNDGSVQMNNGSYSGTLHKANGNLVDEVVKKLATGNALSTSAPVVTDLSTINVNYTASNGETLTGTLASNVKISIADGATVTLNNVTINGTNDSKYYWAGITCLGDATIILSGTNTVKGFYENYPGIQTAASKTLIINGTGSLTASSYSYAAAIGGGNGLACGNIEIQGGTITATSGGRGAGIGGGINANCGNITISGGTVTATGGERGAGIGGGYNASWGNITISGGNVTATGGNNGAGIGGGKRGNANFSCGNINISGGTVTATGGQGAAGIGGGSGTNNSYESSCGTITITTDVTKVTATKGSDATNSIGAGQYGTCGTVTIGGNVGAITTSPYTYQPE